MVGLQVERMRCIATNSNWSGFFYGLLGLFRRFYVSNEAGILGNPIMTCL